MGRCFVLLYSSFMQCFFATANLKICTQESPYRPIYTLKQCSYSQDINKVLREMDPIIQCRSK